MSFTVFLGNLPTWVTADDIQSWLNAEALVADSIKVIRNPETQESKGFAFIDAPNAEEMQSIIRRFDRAPLEDKLLRANPAQPPKGKGAPRTGDAPPPRMGDRRPRSGDRSGDRMGARPAGDRPAGDRTQAGAQASANDRPQGDRAQGAPSDRPQGDRPQGDRPQGSADDRNKRRSRPSGTSAFAEELAKAL